MSLFKLYSPILFLTGNLVMRRLLHDALHRVLFLSIFILWLRSCKIKNDTLITKLTHSS